MVDFAEEQFGRFKNGLQLLEQPRASMLCVLDVCAVGRGKGKRLNELRLIRTLPLITPSSTLYLDQLFLWCLVGLLSSGRGKGTPHRPPWSSLASENSLNVGHYMPGVISLSPSLTLQVAAVFPAAQVRGNPVRLNILLITVSQSR